MLIKYVSGEEVTRGWGKLHNEERNLYSSPDIIRVMRSRMMKLTGHITHGKDKKCIQKT
jgi:hypothetical protein